MSRPLILFILAVVNFCHIVDSMLMMPLGDIFVSEFDIGGERYSWLVGAYSFAAFLSSIAGIFFIDRFGRKRALLFLLAGFALGTFLCSFVQSYWVFVALRFVTGGFGGVIGAIVFAIVADLYKFKERGFAMGVIFTAFSAASVLGVPLSLWFAAKFNWTVSFRFLGIFAGIVGLINWFYFPTLKSHLSGTALKRSYLKILQNIYTDANQVSALTLGMILVLGHFIIIPFISPSLIRNVGFSQMEISYMFFFGGLATVVSAPVVGKLVDKYGVFPVFVVALFCSFVPTIALTQMDEQPLWYALIYSTLFFIFASSRMIAPNTIITAAVGTETRGSFMSVKSALQQLAIFIATLISGQVVYLGEDGKWQNYEILGYVSIAICLICIPLIRRLKVAEGN